MPKVSIVIPCYNQGDSVVETLNSALQQSYHNIEIIIVDDGSDDQKTKRVLKEIQGSGITVLRTENQGLAAARNNGISIAKGKYILPLDSDDLIDASYVEKAVHILETHKEIGIVYSRAQLFGAVDTEWLLPDYSLEQILLDNIIFCSALFRKSDWQEMGGYDTGMIYGWEDYDFWLSLIERGREVHKIPEILFSYRVAADSMVRSKARWQKVAMFKRIFNRHEKLFTDNIEVWINSLLDVREKYFTSKLYVDCGHGISDQNCISRKVDIGTTEVQFSLKGFENISNIRFDPIDTPAVVNISQIVIEDEQGDTCELKVFTDNSTLQLDNDRYFDTDDSQCFFSLTYQELSKIKTITVRLSFKAVGEDALREIIKYQKNKLQDHEASGTLKARIKAFIPCIGKSGSDLSKIQKGRKLS